MPLTIEPIVPMKTIPDDSIKGNDPFVGNHPKTIPWMRESLGLKRSSDLMWLV